MRILQLLSAAPLVLAAMLVSSPRADAVEAASTTTLNVRTGPGTEYSVVDSLDPGEVVEVGECISNGWCYIYQTGPNGWVSSRYLSAVTSGGGSGSGSGGGSGSGSGSASSDDCKLNLTFDGTGRPALTLTCGNASVTATTPPPTTPEPDKACFYTGTNYTGAEFCTGLGSINSLNATFRNRISSVKLFGAAKAKLCQFPNLAGYCRVVATDRTVLPASINNRAASLIVFTGSSPTPPPPPPPTARACFYTGPNYTGANFCRGVGVVNVLNTTFRNRITSVRLVGGARARLCRGTGLSGYCVNITSNRPLLNAAMNNRAASLRVFVGAPPPPSGPVTHSTGTILLPRGAKANLDNGTVGGGSGMDIWYKSPSPALRNLVPINGARFALGSGRARGYAGCRAATYTSGALSLWVMPVGTYVCVKTSAGRISQFRVNGYVGSKVRLGYTTWQP